MWGPKMDLEHLLVLVSGGDENAFNHLYTETSGKIYAIALLMLRQQELAEEVVQETYLRIWQQSVKFSPEKGTPMAWMTTIARRLAIDRIRFSNRQEKTDRVLEEHAQTLAQKVAQEEHDLSDQVWICLRKLNSDRARLILLAFFAGYTHEELAFNSDQPLGTVKSSIRRGLLSLKKCLGAEV